MEKQKGYDIADAMVKSSAEALGVGIKAVNLVIGSTVTEVWNGVGKYIVQQETGKVLRGAEKVGRSVAKVIFERGKVPLQ